MRQILSNPLFSFSISDGKCIEILREQPLLEGLHASYTATEAPLDALEIGSLTYGCGWGAYLRTQDGLVKRLHNENENVLSFWGYKDCFLLLTAPLGQKANQLILFEKQARRTYPLPANLHACAAAFAQDGFWLFSRTESVNIYHFLPDEGISLIASISGKIIGEDYPDGFFVPDWEWDDDGSTFSIVSENNITRWRLYSGGALQELDKHQLTCSQKMISSRQADLHPAIIFLDEDGGFDAPTQRSFSFEHLTHAGYAVCIVHLPEQFSPFDETSLNAACAALQQAFEAFVQQGGIDTCRIAAMAYGVGCIVLAHWINQYVPPCQAAILHEPVANWISLSSLSAKGSAYVREHSSQSLDELAANPPLIQIANIRTPVLLLHDRWDDSIPLCESICTLSALKLREIRARLCILDHFAYDPASNSEYSHENTILHWLSYWMEVK